MSKYIEQVYIGDNPDGTPILKTIETYGNVRYDKSQDLTEEEQLQVKANLGIGVDNISQADLDKKVDKVEGKQLSDRNFTQVLETQIETNQSDITRFSNRIITNMIPNTDPSKIPTDGAVRAYTQAEIAKFDFIKVVSSLPEPSQALPNRIYMVPKPTQPKAIDPSTQKDLFDEYIWAQGSDGAYYWEFVGTKSVEVDLTDYYNKSQCDNTFLQKDGIDVAKLKALLNSIAAVNGTVKFNKEVEAPSFNDIP